MNNFDGITRARYNLLVTKYDMMYQHMNDSYADSLTAKFAEFRKSCDIPINTFEEKVAFMLQFEEKIREEERKEEIERLKEEKKALIELAKQRYDSKSFFWKLSHKSQKPDKLDFDSMSSREIGELYNDDTKKIK